MKTIFLFLSLSFFLFLLGCSQDSNQNHLNSSQNLKEPLIEANKARISLESDQINAYVKRRKWDVNTTGTGLRYKITKHGNGDSVKIGQTVTVNYEVSLLSGKKCYSTNKKPQKFVVGMDNVESGLHEAMQYLKVGDHAILILPSHLAHGLIGDRNKIPAKSTIIYDIQLLAAE